MILLLLMGSLILSIGLFLLLPKPKTERAKRLRIFYGFEKTQKQAQSIGIQLTLKHYVGLIAMSIILGVIVGWISANILLAAVAVGVGFVIPKMIFAAIRHKKRRELLLNLPANLRLLASKFRDSKSLQKSLEMSLPVMSGPTVEHFQNLYHSLLLGVDARVALEQMRIRIGFQKFDDLCEKILMGQRDGYHTRVVEGIRETIDDIALDIQLLKQLDIENGKKRFNVYIVFGLCWAFPFIFNYMESQVGSDFGIQTTLQSPLGKVLVATMATITLVGLFKRDKYLRLNLDDL